MAVWHWLRKFNLRWIANLGLAIGVVGQAITANDKMRDAICLFSPKWCIVIGLAGAFGTGMAYLGRPHSVPADPKKP